MNITYYKRRLKRLKKEYKSGNSRYSNKKLENWIEGCRRKIKELQKKKNKMPRANRKK